MSKEPLHRVSARLAAIAPSATLAVDAKAKALKAAGRPVIGYAAGEPDFPTPENVVEAALRAAKEPSSYKYSPAAGLPALREAVAQVTSQSSGIATDASQVLITNGGKQAVFQACAALINPGDEVLLPAPYWTTYPETIQLAGGVTVPVEGSFENGYKVSVEQLEAARTERTVALIHCSPSNPTGAVYTEEETAAIGQWALENGIWVISDEIYDHLVYGDAKFTSILTTTPELANQTVLLNGVAKTYAMTGWRVGWMTGPADVIKAATSFQSHATSNVNNIAQKAALEALTGPQDEIERMRQAFDRRRILMVDLLRALPGFEVPVPDGAFYAFPRVQGLIGREIRGRTPQNTTELAEIILDEVEVALVPGEAFGTPGYLRLSYALGESDLVSGLERIQGLLS
ncbi:pyridoxal phosphate-dependent aminotransferase [Scrofimicrobium sp. R131]|uniref:Aminotransferase n=1 Tax=Scrofimicrobium appendicitidis TaxID=3079930 RepID=A0AAU7V8U0_9ACTO